MKQKKTILSIAMLAVLALALAGCSSEAQVVPTPQPQATAQFMPQNAQNSAANSAAPENTMQYDWANNAAQVEEGIKQLAIKVASPKQAVQYLANITRRGLKKGIIRFLINRTIE